MASGREEPHDIEKLMRLLSTRMSWTAATRTLSLAGLHASRGWGESITAFRGSLHSYSEAQLEIARDVLESAFVTHTYVGNKQVSWYDMAEWNPEQRAATLRWADSLDLSSPPQSLELRRWIPADVPYDQDVLARRGSAPRLVEVTRIENRLYFLYFCVRTYALRETIDLSEVPDDERTQVLRGYQEVIGVRREHLPCFDCCVLDLAAQRLEVRIDFHPNYRSDEQAAALPAVVHQFNRVLMAQLQITPAGYGLVNFFPAVTRIYEDPTAGRVYLLSFVATGANSTSNNSGKTHRNRTQDLRSDHFHVGGRGNVDSIAPYAIGARWPSREPGGEPLQIEILGTVKHVYLPNAVVSNANFQGCSTAADYDFLLGELARHL